MKTLTLEILETRTLLSANIHGTPDATEDLEDASANECTANTQYFGDAYPVAFDQDALYYKLTSGTRWDHFGEPGYISPEIIQEQELLLKLHENLRNGTADPRLQFFLDRWNKADDPIVLLLQEKFEIGQQMGYTFLTYGYAINTGYTVSLATPMLITCKNTDPLLLSLRGGSDLIAIVCAGFEMHSHAFDDALGKTKIELYDDALDQYNHAKIVIDQMTENGEEVDKDQLKYLADKRNEANAHKVSFLLGKALDSASTTSHRISSAWGIIGINSLTNLGLEILLKDPIVQAVKAIEEAKDNFHIEGNVITALKEAAENRDLRSSLENIITVAERNLGAETTLPETVKAALKEGVSSLKLYQYAQYFSRGLNLLNSAMATGLFTNDLIALWDAKIKSETTLGQAIELANACNEKTCTDLEQELAIIAGTIASEQNPSSHNIGLMWTSLKWAAALASHIPTLASMGALPRTYSGPANTLTYWGFLIGSVGYASQGLIEFGLSRMLDIFSWSFTEHPMSKDETALRADIFKALEHSNLDTLDITESYHNILKNDPDVAARVLLEHLSREQGLLANLSDHGKKAFTLKDLENNKRQLPVSLFLAKFDHAINDEEIIALANAATLNPDDASALLRRRLGF